jgi:hypothetical protein
MSKLQVPLCKGGVRGILIAIRKISPNPSLEKRGNYIDYVFVWVPIIRETMARAANTPHADACNKPLVMPAPSPIANRFFTFVSISFETSMRLE